MTSLGNSLNSDTMLRLQARKSFALGLFIGDHHGKPLDIAGCTLRLVVRKQNFSTDTVNDSDNLIDTDLAEITGAGAGYARFLLQASDLDFKPGEYEYSVTLITQEGYSTLLFQGILELQQNTEYSSVNSVYTEGSHDQSISVRLANQHVVQVRTGPSLAPGTTSYTDQDKAKLDGIEHGAQVNVKADWDAEDDSPQQILNKPVEMLVPPGGGRGSVLFKNGPADGDTVWVPIITDPGELLYPGTDVFPGIHLFPGGGGPSGYGLDATGIPAGMSPVSTGEDTWRWGPGAGVTSINGLDGDVLLKADDIGDGLMKVMMTLVERQKLQALTMTPEWNSIANKPLFGTAALLNADQVIQKLGVRAIDIVSGVIDAARLPKVSALTGQNLGTADPTGGVDGDVYWQYTP